MFFLKQITNQQRKIIMNNPPEPCKPFTSCWCETRPNNPHCVNAIPIDNSIAILAAIACIYVFFRLKTANIIVKYQK